MNTWEVHGNHLKTVTKVFFLILSFYHRFAKLRCSTIFSETAAMPVPVPRVHPSPGRWPTPALVRAEVGTAPEDGEVGEFLTIDPVY